VRLILVLRKGVLSDQFIRLAIAKKLLAIRDKKEVVEYMVKVRRLK
jgi:hypothetical protein